MSVSSDPGCAGKKSHKRMGGMAEAVAIASDLGFLINQVQEMSRHVPAALASCTCFYEAMSVMRDSFATLQQFRVSNNSLLMTPSDNSGRDSKIVT